MSGLRTHPHKQVALPVHPLSRLSPVGVGLLEGRRRQPFLQGFDCKSKQEAREIATTGTQASGVAD